MGESTTLGIGKRLLGFGIWQFWEEIMSTMTVVAEAWVCCLLGGPRSPRHPQISFLFELSERRIIFVLLLNFGI